MSDAPAPDPTPVPVPEITATVAGARLDIPKTLVAMTVLGLWAASLVLEQIGWQPVSEGSKQILNTAVTLVIGYYLGSSSGSATRAAVQDAVLSRVTGVLGR